MSTVYSEGGIHWLYAGFADGSYAQDSACYSNVDILQRFQSKTLRLITDAPWFVNNNIIHNDLNVPKIKDEIKRFSTNYLIRLSNHPNVLAITLLDDSDEVRRLKRLHILDLPFLS